MRRMYSKKELEDAIKFTKKDISTLVNADGYGVFVTQDGTPEEIIGLTSNYCKWSLSGTHLMLVFCGSLADATILNNSGLVTYELPK